MSVGRIIKAMATGPQVFFAKNTVLRTRYPIEINVSEYKHDDYLKIIPVLKEIDNKILTKKPNAKGLRWIHSKEGTAWFYGEREVNVPYDEFIKRVDINHVGRFYRDSISVDTQVVSKDEQGRSDCQVVRVVALPQPNYAAFMGKENLDVTKLEKIDYTDNEQRVWMLTVDSPNGSAVCDDGYLAFKRSGNNNTIVTFLACQNFPVPPLMAMLFLDRWHWFRDTLTEFAYSVFFEKMMKNIIDCYEGKHFDVGREIVNNNFAVSKNK